MLLVAFEKLASSVLSCSAKWRKDSICGLVCHIQVKQQMSSISHTAFELTLS